MMVLSLRCFSLSCQRGIRCAMCWHSCAFSSAMHAAHASWIWIARNMGVLVRGSTLLMSLE
jgi:hypothetical protein